MLYEYVGDRSTMGRDPLGLDDTTSGGSPGSAAATDSTSSGCSGGTGGSTTSAVGGSVAFSVDGNTPVNESVTNGQAVFSTSSLSVGSHKIVASYLGTSAFAPSQDMIAAQVVNQASSATTLAYSGSFAPGQPLSLTATVAAQSPSYDYPTGSVTFLDGATSLGTVSLEELRKAHDTPQIYQFYFHKDRGLNRAMMQRAKEAGVQVMMLTVDSITGGNRERDLRTGFSIPFRLTPAGTLQFAVKPMWAINYLTHERFRLPQLDQHVDMGGGTLSIQRYFTEMLDPSMSWDDVAKMVQFWDGQFCLKGIMSVADARRAAADVNDG